MDAEIVRRPPFGANPAVGERGSDTRRRILDAALEVYGEVPFSEVRVELITERAGCSRPAFYQYFSNRDEVFWTLATGLGHEMVDLTRRLGTVTPDSDGLAHLTGWVEEFMAMHEAWAPVFDSFTAARRGRPDLRTDGPATFSDRTARALLKAFGRRATVHERTVAQLLVAVLIRCSFYAEHAPKGTDRKPMTVGVARLLHRCLAGPIDGVNMRRVRPKRRARVRVTAYEPSASAPELPPRGRRTRDGLLEAGATVLPELGYHATRVDDIVAAAEVSHGTFYRYFDNKDAFFRVLAEAAAARMIELVDRMPLTGSEADLREWLGEWIDAYDADGGIISTWQEMRASADLGRFSQEIGAAVFTRLERHLAERPFGQPVVAAATLLALIERGPYAVSTLGFTTRERAIEAMSTIMRRGFLGDDG